MAQKISENHCSNPQLDWGPGNCSGETGWGVPVPLLFEHCPWHQGSCRSHGTGWSTDDKKPLRFR